MERHKDNFMPTKLNISLTFTVIPNLFLDTVSVCRAQCSTRLRNVSTSDIAFSKSSHGNSVACWKNDKSGHRRL